MARVAYRRAFLVLFVTALFAGLPAAAYADPPDPTWIGGFWDDDDFDTVVVFIGSASAILTPAAADVRPSLAPIAWVARAEPAVVPATARNTGHSRAPPVSSLPHC